MIATIPPAPPAPTEQPNRDLVSSWHLGSMDKYLDLTTRHGVARQAAKADRFITEGADHLKVMLALAGAECGAPEDERHLHAARTDAYAALHGLKGWYRYTSERGEHRVAVNYLRTTDDGEVGRYFYYTPSTVAYPKVWAVIDRDTGKVMARATVKAAADEWIARAEGTWGTEPVAVQPAAASNLHWSERPVETVDVLAGVVS